MKILSSFVLLFSLSTAFAQEKPELKVNMGHAKSVISVCFSPNGKYALSASSDKTIKLWDIVTGKEIKTFFEQTYIESICFSPDGKYALSGSQDKTLKLWDINSGEKSKTFYGHSHLVKSVCFSSDGKYALSGSGDKTIKLWNINTGREIKTFSGHTDHVYSVCFSPDDKYALSGSSDNTMILWEINTGKVLRIFSDHTSAVLSVCFSPDGKYILSGSADNTIKLYEFSTGKIISSFSDNVFWAGISSVSFSPDGKFILSGGNNGIKLWDISTGKEIRTFSGHTNQVVSVCFSPDGKYALSGSWDKTIKLWEISTGKEIRSFSGNISSIYSVCLSPDQKYALSNNRNHTLKLWEIGTGKGIKTFSTPTTCNMVSSVSFSPDSKYALYGSCDKDVKLLEINTAKMANTFSLNSLFSFSACFSTDGKYALGGSGKTFLKLWEINTGKEIRTFSGHKLNVKSVCFSHNGNYALSGSSDKTLKLWDISTGKEVRTFSGHKSTVRSVCFSHNGNYALSGSSDKTLKLWEISTGKEIRTFSGHTRSVNSVCFSPDSKYALSGSDDKTLKLWEISTGREIKTFSGHSDYVKSICFFSNGKYVLSGSWDGTMKIWDINSGKELATLYSIGETDWVVTTPDGRFDASEDGIKYLYYVQGMDIIPLESFFEQFYTPNLLARVLSDEQFEKTGVDITKGIKLPPSVTITTPKTGETFTTDQLTITVEATDQGGGIDEIRLYHNGKMVETTQRGFKKIEQKEEVSTKTFSIQLVNGKNIIKATAFNNQRTEAIPDEITVLYEGAKATSNLYMLVIGIDEYKKPQLRLNYAIADANAFLEEIKTKSNTIFGNAEITFIQNTDVTRERIVQEFSNLKSKTKPEDVFIFYYAGHGVMSEEANSEFHLIPYDVIKLYDNDELDSKAISASELLEFSKDIKAQKQMFVLDACQSGGMTEILASRGAAEEKAIAQLARSTGTFWLTATNSEQNATEFTTLGHGLFTYAILLGLQGQADGKNNDKKITVKELSAFLDDIIPELSQKYKGEAQYPNIYGWGMDFPIVIVK